MRGENNQLRLLSPVLDEMLQIIDASYVANGEVQMDYTRFRVLHQQARNGLGRLGIQLPALNEGGNATIFNRELRRIAHHARIGDYAGARRGAYTKHSSQAADPTPPAKRPEPVRQSQPAREHDPGCCVAVISNYLQNITARVVAAAVVAALLWLVVQCS